MAAAGGATPGGIVSIQAIIDQIVSIQEGMNAIVDAVLDSTQGILLAAKVRLAKRRIKQTTAALKTLILAVDEAVKDMLTTLDTQAISQDFSQLVNNPILFGQQATNLDPKTGVNNLADKKAGVLEVLIGLMSAIQLISEMEFPGPVKLFVRMMKLKLSLGILKWGISSIVQSIQDITTQLQTQPVDMKVFENIQTLLDAVISLCGAIAKLALVTMLVAFVIPIAMLGMIVLAWGVKSIVKSINRMTKALTTLDSDLAAIEKLQLVLDSIMGLCGTLALIALVTTIMAPITPIIIIGMYIVVLTIRIIIRMLRTIGNPEFLMEVYTTINNVKRILRKILACIVYIALVFVALALTIVLVGVIGGLLPQLIVPFLVGVTILMGTFLIIWVMMWVMAKLVKKIAGAAVEVLIFTLITAVVLIILSLTFLVIATIAQVVIAHIWDVIILLGIMGVTLLAIMGFMALAASIAPAIAVGLAAMALVFLSVLVLMALVGALMLLTWIAGYLDEKATQEAVDKVMRVAEHTVQAILNTQFSGQREGEKDGVVRQLVGDLMGNEFLAIFDLAVKAIILMMTLVAVIIMFALVAVLVGFVKYYQENKKEIDEAPKIVNTVMTGAAEIIQTVLNSNTGAKIGESDGLFLALVGFVLGQDVVTIFKLLFKVVIVMLTIVVLLMMRVLMSELKWIFETYEKYGGVGFFGPGGVASQMIATIMGGCNEIINSIIHNETAGFDVEGDGLFITLIKVVSPDLGNIIALLFKVLVIAMTMIVLAMLKVVMRELKWLWLCYQQDFGGDAMLNNVVNMVTNILGAVDKIIKLLASKPKNEPNDPPRSGLQKLLDFIGLHTLADIIGLLCKFVRIGLAILALSVLQSVALIMKDVWDTYQSMGGDAIGTNATKMVEGIGRGINSIIRAMMGIKVDFGKAERRDEGKFHWKVWNVAYNAILDLIDNIFGGGITGLMTLMDAAGNMRAAIPIVTALGAVAEYINRMMKVMDTSINGMRTAANTTIPEMISLVGQMVNQINTMEIGDLELCDQNLQKIDETCKKISKTFNNLLGGRQGSMAFVVRNAKSYNAAVNDTDRLINKINGLDIAKMSVLAKMFGNAAAFSQSLNGNFDKLAEVITEKLTPIMEGLQKTIEDADKHIEEYTKRQEEAQNRMAESQSQMAQAQTGFFAQMAQKAGGAAQAAVGAVTQTPPQPKPQVERSKDADIAAAIKKALETVTVRVKT